MSKISGVLTAGRSCDGEELGLEFACHGKYRAHHAHARRASGMRMMGSTINMTTTAVPFYYIGFGAEQLTCRGLLLPTLHAHHVSHSSCL